MAEDTQKKMAAALAAAVLAVFLFTGRRLDRREGAALLGGYVLRQVMIDIGQESTWTSYDTQYNAELLQRLHE